MLFCEGSGRDKQIAQESSGHKDGRTGAGIAMPPNNGSVARRHRQHRHRQQIVI